MTHPTASSDSQNLSIAATSPVPAYHTREADLDLLHVLASLRRHWKIIGAVCLVAALATAAIAWGFIANEYRAEGTYIPAPQGGEERALSGGGGLAGLASLGGIHLGSDNSKLTKALALLQSRTFLADFAKRHDLLVPLFAGKGWNRDADQIVLDAGIYDGAAKRWVRKPGPSGSVTPTPQEAAERLSKLIKVNYKEKDNLVSISLQFYSPSLAKQWLDLLVHDVNELVQNQDRLEAKRNIEYLSLQMNETQVPALRSAFSQLIQANMKTLMTADLRDEYVLEAVDPPMIPEKKSNTSRALLLILAVLTAFVFSSLGAVAYDSLSPRTRHN